MLGKRFHIRRSEGPETSHENIPVDLAYMTAHSQQLRAIGICSSEKNVAQRVSITSSVRMNSISQTQRARNGFGRVISRRRLFLFFTRY